MFNFAFPSKQLHMLKRDISYLGYTNGIPPVVFAFEKRNNVEKVRNRMKLKGYEVRYYPGRNYFQLEKNPKKHGYSKYSIESKSWNSFEIYIDSHELELYIVNEIVVDEDNNMLLYSEESKNKEKYM